MPLGQIQKCVPVAASGADRQHIIITENGVADFDASFASAPKDSLHFRQGFHRLGVKRQNDAAGLDGQARHW